MEDIRKYSDKELYFRVFNEQWLYNYRHEENFLASWVNQEFVYTGAQLTYLEKELKSDLEEIQSEHHREYLNG